MRDGVEIENRGIPAVVMAQDAFEKAARTQAKNLGMPSLNIVVVAQRRPWHTDEFRRQEIEGIMPRVVTGLIAPAKAMPQK